MHIDNYDEHNIHGGFSQATELLIIKKACHPYRNTCIKAQYICNQPQQLGHLLKWKHRKRHQHIKYFSRGKIWNKNCTYIRIHCDRPIYDDLWRRNSYTIPIWLNYPLKSAKENFWVFAQSLASKFFLAIFLFWKM